jgi:hypothetical protein
MNKINQEKLKELGLKWKFLNEKYDNAIVELIDLTQPTQISPEKLEEMRNMQDEIFDLEVDLYKVLQGEQE